MSVRPKVRSAGFTIERSHVPTATLSSINDMFPTTSLSTGTSVVTGQTIYPLLLLHPPNNNTNLLSSLANGVDFHGFPTLTTQSAVPTDLIIDSSSTLTLPQPMVTQPNHIQSVRQGSEGLSQLQASIPHSLANQPNVIIQLISS